MIKPTGKTIKLIPALALFTAFGLFFSVSGRSSNGRGYDLEPSLQTGATATKTDDGCVTCHQKQSDESVSLFKASIHGRTRKTCSSCHGGDAAASDKAAAHSGRFVGQPSSNEILTMCGACHTSALASFKTSRHFPERRGSPRIDCAQCHGAHSVGSAARNFSFAYYCTGCHGLEYLPRLPDELQKTLSMSDDLSDAIRARESSGRPLTADELQRRKEIRRSIAEIVHPTDLRGIEQKAADVQKLIREMSK